MRLLSSRATFLNKRVVPAIWFGLSLAPMAVLFVWPEKHFSPVPFLFMPLVAIAIGYFALKKRLFDLADEVWDAGDALLIRKGGNEQRIPISEIMNVSYAELRSPPRVTLSLRTPSVFGEHISFCAPIRIVPLSRSPIIVELIERVRAARRLRRRRLLRRRPTTSMADRVDVDGRQI